MNEWDTLQAIYRARGAATRALHQSPPIQQIQDELQVNPALIGQFIYVCDNYNVQALSTEHYRVRNCYDNPLVIDRLWVDLAADGLIEPRGDVYYRITERGLQVLKRVDEILRPRWSLPPVEIEELAVVLTLLPRVIAVTEIEGTWSVKTRQQYGFKLAPDAPPFQELNARIFDLWAYRDDVHLLAWQPVFPGLSPCEWETFTYIWRGEAQDVDSLNAALQIREYSPEIWTEALDNLVERGWLMQQDGTYMPTDEGSQIRQQAEDETNEHFYKAFEVLRGNERQQLNTALEAVRDALEAMV